MSTRIPTAAALASGGSTATLRRRHLQNLVALDAGDDDLPPVGPEHGDPLRAGSGRHRNADLEPPVRPEVGVVAVVVGERDPTARRP